MLALFLFAMLYYSAMPVIFLFVFASLLLLYWSMKITFVKFCRKPPIYSHSISRLCVKICFYGVLINCIVSPLYFGAESYNNGVALGFFQRILLQWYYVVLFFLILLYLLFKKYICRASVYLKHCVQDCWERARGG